VTRLFDTYVAVDWSASSRPKYGPDSIWSCVAGHEPENHGTRHEATERLRSLLRREASAGRRVLVGFDFPYAYPSGFAPWRRLWDMLVEAIEDDARNANNRFDVAASLNVGPGPFWGCPASRACATLTTKRTVRFPYQGLAEFREVERRVRGVQSVWKLGGAGSVGSQALLGIPRVASLRDDAELSSVSAVWPFETGFDVPAAQVVHVEIWPGLVERLSHPVKDAGQVAAVVRHWQELDETGRLAPLFRPAGTPPELEREEGWIFG
jgi:hypothetical protein